MTPVQGSLILAPTHRSSDPETSGQAVPSDEHLSALQTELLDWFTAWCPHGSTDAELCASFDERTPGTLIKRRGELVAAGLVRDSGERRPVPRTGRMAVVWVAA